MFDVSTRALVVCGASALASVIVVALVWRRHDPLTLRLGTTLVAFVPILGPLFGLWVLSFPDRMHPNLQAKYKNTINSYSMPPRKANEGESDVRRRDAV